MTTSLKSFVEQATKEASRVFLARGRLSPTYHAVDGAGNEHIFPAPPGTKNQSVALVRALLKAMDAQRVAYMDEAWVLHAAAAEGGTIDIDKINREGVEHQPGRIEMVIVSGEDQHEGLLTCTREIIRHGDRVTLGAPTIEHFDHSEGRMIGLLPPRGTAQ
jgi:hypothetical protein